MNASEHNRKVAFARWRNVRAEERSKFAVGTGASVARAALAGFLAGDGSVKARYDGKQFRYDVRFYPDDDEMLATFLRLFGVVYGKTPVYTRMKGYYYVRISSRSIGEDILNYSALGLYTWLPPALHNDEEKAAWLRAFFSAEGYVGVKSVRVQTVNEKGMLAVSQLLDYFGINHGCYTYHPKNPKHSTVFIVTILKRSAREKFSKTIGFWHAAKIRALRKALDLKVNL